MKKGKAIHYQRTALDYQGVLHFLAIAVLSLQGIYI